MTGYFKLYRETLRAGLLKKSDELQVWIFLCEQARFRETVEKGIALQPGQALLSSGIIARACCLDRNRVQYILRSFEKRGLIRMESMRNRCTRITIRNPDEKQEVPPAAEAETESYAMHTKEKKIKEEENEKEEKEKKENSTHTPAQTEEKECCGLCMNVYLTAEEKQILHEKSELAEYYIDNLSAYKRRTHKNYDDDFAVLCEWISKDLIREKQEAARMAAVQLRQEKDRQGREREMQNREKERYCERASTSPSYVDTNFFTAPASYDLEAAERQARESVPVLRKRKR